MLTSDPYMNLSQFFKRGFTYTKIDLSRADSLLKIVENHNFLDPAVTPDREDSYYSPETQLFHSKAIPRSTVLEGDESVSPFMGAGFKTKEEWETVNEFWKEMVGGSYFSWFRNNLGTFTQISKQACSYRVNSGFSFHSHTKDTPILINVLYLGDRDFVHEDGGFIEFGACPYDNEGEPDFNTVDYRGFVLPNHGTMATFLNIDPGIMHAVHRLYKPKTRYSLIAQCGYSEHMGKALSRKNWTVL